MKNFSCRGIYQRAATLLLLLLVPVTASSSGEDTVRVDRIRIFGNERIKTYVIAREIPFRAGDYITGETVRETREKIRRIPGVDFSEIRLSYLPGDSTAVVSVIVTEKPTLRGYLLTGRGYENKISIGIRAEDDNFRGRGEKLYASGLFRGNTVLEAGWENPWVGGSLHLGIGFRSHYMKYRYVYDDMGPDLRDAQIERAGVSLIFYRGLGGHQKISFEGGFETVRSPVEGMTVEPDADDYLVFSLGFTRDTRKSTAFPWNATRLEIRGDLIGPEKENLSIVKASVDARKYLGLFSRTVLALQFLFRTRDGENIPPYEREHMGGSKTLRGYDYGTFNGTGSILGGVEYRIPFNFTRDEPIEYMFLGVSLHLFAEAGTTWEKGEEPDMDALKSSFGLGMSLLTKNATGIRFDYGWTTRSTGRWEIDAGLKF